MAILCIIVMLMLLTQIYLLREDLKECESSFIISVEQKISLMDPKYDPFNETLEFPFNSSVNKTMTFVT